MWQGEHKQAAHLTAFSPLPLPIPCPENHCSQPATKPATHDSGIADSDSLLQYSLFHHQANNLSRTFLPSGLYLPCYADANICS